MKKITTDLPTLLETERTVVSYFTDEDLTEYAALVADSKVMRHIGDGKPRSHQHAVDFINQCMADYKDRGWSRYTIFEKSTNNFLGFCGFDDALVNGQDEIDFGWRYKQESWGKGYATEVAKAVLQHSQHTHPFERIICQSYQDNVASIAVIKKLNFQFEKTFTHLNRVVELYALNNDQ